MKTCAIFNPTARGEKAVRFREHLETLRGQCVLFPTTGAGGGRPLGAQAVRDGFELVLAAGGDGTVNEVINGIADEPDGLRTVCFGVIPLGTVNVFAKELEIPSSLTGAWSVILAGRTRLVDLLYADFSQNGRLERRFFVQMAGAGFDSLAIREVRWEQKKRWGALAYVFAALRLLGREMPKMSVGIGKEVLTAEMVLVGNGRFYGGKFQLFPKADAADGLLEVTLFPRISGSSLLRTALGVFTGRLYTGGGVSHWQGDAVTLTSATPIPFHLEGDNIGHLPVQMGVQKQALRVRVP